MNFNFKYNKSVAAKQLADPDTSAFVLMTILLSSYAELNLHKELSAVLFANLEDDFHCKIPPENENKINAGITCMTTDLCYRSWSVFTAVALAFNAGDIGDIPDGAEEELEAVEALWAMHVIALLCDDDLSNPEELYGSTVLSKITDLIQQEAYDNESIADDVDTVEEALDEPYFMKYIKVNIKETAVQLRKLGCGDSVIQELLDMYDIVS